MSNQQDIPSEREKLLFEEYKLAIETQMHFNDLLMKLRSLGLTAVIIILGFAISQTGSATLPIIGIVMSLAQIIAAFALVLLISLAILDFFYFFPLLLGAVARSKEIEDSTQFRLTGAIIKKVGSTRAWIVLAIFYIVTFVVGFIVVLSCTGIQKCPG